MREITVVSGKGGTGKTSLSAAFAELARPVVAVDCDVDASNLPLVVDHTVRETRVFHGGHIAEIREADCMHCAVCYSECRFRAIDAQTNGDGMTVYRIDPLACEGCGVCVEFCPTRAIDFPETPTGTLFVSETPGGPLVHARLDIGAENSGKLVSQVRQRARDIAESEGRDLILIDGPPGIGCPTIAALTGASMAVVVTEPTVAGEHDLERVLSLTKHFGIPTCIIVNKWDLNAEAATRIEERARALGAGIAGRVRYAPEITEAQMRGESIAAADTPAAEEVRAAWRRIAIEGEKE